MNMSDEEENNFCYFGKPLDAYDEDSFPRKKPISIEDQIATDAQGRRRFHGAFTGGFSAGFFNTVGSLEGWTPSEFKSTRQEKAKSVSQKPEDFMDQEDLEEHGIAPQTLKATKEYSTSKKRKKQVFSDGPIPGIPVLETLLTSGNETIGYLLLKKIGIKEKIRKQYEMNSDLKIYSCQIPDKFQISEQIEHQQYRIPEIYTDNLGKPKSNTFGLGYKGLDRNHVNLFTGSSLVMTDNKNKKMSISGQAFGVGAFEEDDEDIYSKEDMSNYDYEIGKEKQKHVHKDESVLYLGLFKPSKVPLIIKKVYPVPTIPHSFTGKHKTRKSRFEPVDIKIEKQEMDRRTINPAIRARYLGEDSVIHTSSQTLLETNQTEKQTFLPKLFDVASLMVDKFISASSNDNNTQLEVKREIDHGTNDMREAAKMNMFGPLTRVTFDWTPVAILCKRFNVPEPLMDRPEQKNRKRTKNLIFESQKYSVEDNSSFKPECSTDLTTNEPQPSTSQIVNDANEEQTNIKMEVMSPEEKEIDLISGTHNINTDLSEETKDITEKIGIEDKIDLFKAVFMSSSESEDDDEGKEDTETDKQTDEFKETILSDLVPKIKPLKQGILSNLNFQSTSETQVYQSNQNIEKHSEKPITFIPKKDRNLNANNDDSQSKLLSYGPQLPSQKFENSKDKLKTNTISFTDSDVDEWVEKDNESEKSKHKKKSKKSKKRKHSKKDK